MIKWLPVWSRKALQAHWLQWYCWLRSSHVQCSFPFLCSENKEQTLFQAFWSFKVNCISRGIGPLVLFPKMFKVRSVTNSLNKDTFSLSVLSTVCNSTNIVNLLQFNSNHTKQFIEITDRPKVNWGKWLHGQVACALARVVRSTWRVHRVT